MPYDRIEDKTIKKVAYKNDIFESLYYANVRFWMARFQNCTWRNCKFNHVSFAHNTIFLKCRFENCRFWEHNTYLGGPSRFEDCMFLDCDFDKIQFWDTEFIGCRFTGKFRHMVFLGPEAPGVWATRLQDVDMSGVHMQDTDFKAGIDLSTTKFPESVYKTLDLKN